MLGQANVVLIPLNDNGTDYRILVRQSFARYLVEWLIDATVEFAVAPTAYPRRMVDDNDRGPVFDGIRIGRPATGALIDAGYHAVADLPADLDDLLDLHGVGPAAVRLLRQARGQ